MWYHGTRRHGPAEPEHARDRHEVDQHDHDKADQESRQRRSALFNLIVRGLFVHAKCITHSSAELLVGLKLEYGHGARVRHFYLQSNAGRRQRAGGMHSALRGDAAGGMLSALGEHADAKPTACHPPLLSG
jgi:hypothetical protein